MFHGNLKRFKVESELSGRIGSQITGLQTLNRFVKEKKQPREIKANLAGVDVFFGFMPADVDQMSEARVAS